MTTNDSTMSMPVPNCHKSPVAWSIPNSIDNDILESSFTEGASPIPWSSHNTNLAAEPARLPVNPAVVNDRCYLSPGGTQQPLSHMPMPNIDDSTAFEDVSLNITTKSTPGSPLEDFSLLSEQK